MRGAGVSTGPETWTYSIGILLDPATLSGVVGNVLVLDENLAVLKLREIPCLELEGVRLDLRRGRVGDDPDLLLGWKRHDGGRYGQKTLWAEAEYIGCVPVIYFVQPRRYGRASIAGATSHVWSTFSSHLPPSSAFMTN